MIESSIKSPRNLRWIQTFVKETARTYLALRSALETTVIGGELSARESWQGVNSISSKFGCKFPFRDERTFSSLTPGKLFAQYFDRINCSTIHHQINENEINLTIRPRQENFFGEPSHATITIEVIKKSPLWHRGNLAHSNAITCCCNLCAFMQLSSTFVWIFLQED